MEGPLVKAKVYSEDIPKNMVDLILWCLGTIPVETNLNVLMVLFYLKFFLAWARLVHGAKESPQGVQVQQTVAAVKESYAK